MDVVNVAVLVPRMSRDLTYITDLDPRLRAAYEVCRQALAECVALLVPGTAQISVFLAEKGVLDVDGVPILDLHAKSADGAQAVDRRRREHRDKGFLDCAVLLIERGSDGAGR